MKALVVTLLVSGSVLAGVVDSSGVGGHVSLSPGCGGAQAADTQGCRRPFAQALLELLAADGKPVATVRSNEDGSYVLNAPPGRYRLQVRGRAKLQRCPSPSVEISANAHAVVDIECDSGMR